MQVNVTSSVNQSAASAVASRDVTNVTIHDDGFSGQDVQQTSDIQTSETVQSLLDFKNFNIFLLPQLKFIL